VFIDFSCGKCEVSMVIDSEDDTMMWSIVNRFAKAHASCGFASPLMEETPVEKKKLVQPGKFALED
jgi:hypothetical protein